MKGFAGFEGEVMSPNGHIYIGTENDKLAWSEDFSLESLHDQSVFLHEMTHIYQVRTQGCGVICMGTRRAANSNYDYQMESGKAFNSYGIEEQAEMVQDRFRLRNGLRHYRRNNSTLQQLNQLVTF